MSYVLSLFGGVIIGLAVTLMLLFNGRVTGISGIIYGLLAPQKNDWQWRLTFVLGLFVGGIILKQYFPQVFSVTLEPQYFRMIIAGLLVGFGTIWGSGCTSGHGVCGLSRLSIRSVVATLSFMLSGFVTMYMIRHL